MSNLEESVSDFVSLCVSGRSVDAIERYYAEDVVVFENNELARAGREKAAKEEREAIASQPVPPTLKALGHAVNDQAGLAYITWLIRFVSKDEKPMRIEEVAMQRWAGGKIIEERFFYEGAIDESDVG
jgi:ketosteroid isomerase-like protein